MQEVLKNTYEEKERFRTKEERKRSRRTGQKLRWLSQ